jgi:cobalt-zinc-cadmium efflux system membrane fusion protein
MKSLFYLLSVSVFLFSCGKKSTGEIKPSGTQGNLLSISSEQVANAELVLQTASLEEGKEQLSLRGQIESPPQNLISVTFPMGGYVKTTSMLSGARVKKGQVLAVLEDPKFIQLQQEFLISKTKLVQLEAEYERQSELAKTQASSKKQSELARAERDAEKINLKASGERLRMIGLDPEKLTSEKITSSVSVVSPINGFITSVFINSGKYIGEAEPLAELVNPDAVHLTLRVFEKDLEVLQVGQKVNAHTLSNPEKKYTAILLHIGKSLLPDKTVEVHCHFDQLPPELLPGLYMNAEVEVPAGKAYALPKEALISEGEKQFVFTAESETSFRLIPVDVVWETDGRIGVTRKDGKKLDQKVVTRNAYTLYMQLSNEKK